VARVLIVAISDLNQAESSLRRVLNRAAVRVFGVDPSSGIQPHDSVGLVYGAEACVVGLQPRLVSDLRAKYQLDEQLLVLNGNVKHNNQRIQEWLVGGRPPEPEPTYEEILEEEIGDAGPGVLVASDALRQARKVSADPAHNGDKFPAFFRQAVIALRALTETQGLSSTLEQFFAQHAPDVILSPTGTERFTYADPFRSGERTASMHLASRHERPGFFRDRGVKPRLYFDTIAHASGTCVALLYFGPHPTTGKTYRAGNLSGVGRAT
jgi:hypothetical protein